MKTIHRVAGILRRLFAPSSFAAGAGMGDGFAAALLKGLRTSPTILHVGEVRRPAPEAEGSVRRGAEILVLARHPDGPRENDAVQFRAASPHVHVLSDGGTIHAMLGHLDFVLLRTAERPELLSRSRFFFAAKEARPLAFAAARAVWSETWRRRGATRWACAVLAAPFAVLALDVASWFLGAWNRIDSIPSRAERRIGGILGGFAGRAAGVAAACALSVPLILALAWTWSIGVMAWAIGDVRVEAEIPLHPLSSQERLDRLHATAAG